MMWPGHPCIYLKWYFYTLTFNKYCTSCYFKIAVDHITILIKLLIGVRVAQLIQRTPHVQS